MVEYNQFKEVSGPLNCIVDDTELVSFIPKVTTFFFVCVCVSQSIYNLDLCVCLFEIQYLLSLADLVTEFISNLWKTYTRIELARYTHVFFLRHITAFYS